MAYEPTNWKNGDVITAEKLNKLENGVGSGGSGDSDTKRFFCTATFSGITYGRNSGTISQVTDDNGTTVTSEDIISCMTETSAPRRIIMVCTLFNDSSISNPYQGMFELSMISAQPYAAPNPEILFSKTWVSEASNPEVDMFCLTLSFMKPGTQNSAIMFKKHIS